MPEKPAYPEELLHWLWQSLSFDLNSICTVDGQPVVIFDQGTHNKSDGPDFLNANIQIGNLKWYGDVEIHWKVKHWAQHSHQHDRNYNKVVLHVVWEQSSDISALRKDGTKIPTLALKPFTSHSLSSFLNQCLSHESKLLPCAKQFSYISEEAFRSQLQKALKAYFEQKVNDLFSFYDPSLPPSRAWIKTVATGLFDGLGITHNREPMRRLCDAVFPHIANYQSEKEWISFVNATAFNKNKQLSLSLDWKRKGSRPANHPEPRVIQAASYLWTLHQVPFKQWFRGDPSALWRSLDERNRYIISAKTQRSEIMYGTVWLPSLYLLGHLFGAETVQSKAYQAWQNHSPKLPQSLLRPFQMLDVPSEIYDTSLGSIYQLRHFCKPRRCQRCEVFKSAISS